MHELLLFGQVPFTRHEQVLMILAGVAAMQPQPVTERHLVFKPTRSPGVNGVKVAAKPGTSTTQVQALQSQMQGDLFYLQLVSNVNSKSNPPDDGFIKVEDMNVGGASVNGQANHSTTGQTPMVSTKPATDLSKHSWSLEFRDLPEVPGRRPVTSRLMASVPIAYGDVLEFLDALGYVYGYSLCGFRDILLTMKQTRLGICTTWPSICAREYCPSPSSASSCSVRYAG